MYDFTILVSWSDIIAVPLSLLICALVLLIIPCLLPAWGLFTFPEAVNLNLFFAELFVFNLGIIIEALYID
tara:strand:+ start:321 stop:533 length:213 start_codon:yes stop_codon:yes gene_type:complete